MLALVSLVSVSVCTENVIIVLATMCLTMFWVFSFFTSDHALLLLFLICLPSSVLPFLHFSVSLLFFHLYATVSFTNSCSVCSCSLISA